MRRFVRRQSKKAGLPPGSVVHTGTKKVEQVRLSVFDFDEQKCVELQEVGDVAALFPLRDKPTVTWVNVDGLHDTRLIEAIGAHYGFHPLVLEDIAHVGQRPKLEEYDDYLYVVLCQLEWQGDEAMAVEEQVSLIVGKNYLFSFQERPGDDFEMVRERLRSANGKARQRGADYLAYQLIDATVDNYFTILDRVGLITEQVELELLENPAHVTMHRMQQIKRELLVVRRAIWPLRDVLAGLLRTESELVSESTRVYFRDVHDHAVQVVDAVETLRDVVGGMIEIYLAQVSLRTNEVMKVLTMMASIFIPLTFIAGVYGMNFEFMPEIQARWGYPVVLGVMAAVAIGILAWFKKRRWL
ncbi:MAG: magnesium/cobalt transporter CorA [Gemmatimonadetes bacterium]|nr:magnesium/cobalt transporter CorA [Gemmatimonadota bacterium]